MYSIALPVFYFLIVISPLALIFLSGPITSHEYIYETGKAFAIIGFMIVMMQFVLSSRRKWIERPYGLDIIFRFHKSMAMLAGFLILMHPLLLAFGSGHTELLYSIDLPWYILLGKFGLLLILIHILISAFREKIGLGFQKWRVWHNILGAAIIAGIFIHSLIAGGDLDLTALLVLWIAIAAIALIFYIHHKLIVPAQRKDLAYSITDVRQETHDVWTLEMSPPENHPRYEYNPGQFHFIKLLRDRGLPEEEHHFTISSSPTQSGAVTSTIKESGDFTSTIKDTQKGDKVAIEAPFGRFSHVFFPEDDEIAFIAGGIGITPIMSMLRHMRDTDDPRKVTLIYANHTEGDIVFRRELEEMAEKQHPNLTIVHVLDSPGEDWQGETGYVNDEIITKYIPDLSKMAFYICCPPPMRKQMLDILERKNIDSSKIRLEIFSL
ncbi:MAG: ferric reductase-like transmembrane domain-containing protein [Candidatus Kapaibacterium sp.]